MLGLSPVPLSVAAGGHPLDAGHVGAPGALLADGAAGGPGPGLLLWGLVLQADGEPSAGVAQNRGRNPADGDGGAGGGAKIEQSGELE
jgi:hypothetical protein